MLLRQMRYFVSVVENNSFTEAAEQEFNSQSAISQQIQSLETELGTELFIRQHRKFRLTSAGEYFYQESRQILNRIDELFWKPKELEAMMMLILELAIYKFMEDLFYIKRLPNFQRFILK
ncbi:LysR family transcriptional regulator [Enterococcus faecalis]|uniref:LysR family transcriptional regulator n=1 Tax=Enterococcus faecalis TaxID=1351 RepID=UPI00215C55E8|nr:LysR family transcriptional regulator [Enterococcus faecalis]